jgi:hypothetical protein
MKMFGARAVVDDWDARRHCLEPGCVHLTSDPPDVVRKSEMMCRIVNFADLNLPAAAEKADPEAFRRPQSKRFSSHELSRRPFFREPVQQPC